MQCKLCGAGDPQRLHVIRGYTIARCSCGLVYADVDPARVDFSGLYADRYPPSAFLPQRPRKVSKSHRELALLERLTEGRRLLDVGCAYGFFLDTAQRRGWSAVGVELSPESSQFARERYGLEVHTGPLADAPYEPCSFDVVTIRHVLEHVPDPGELITEAGALLRPGGLLAIAVPNFGSLAARLFGAEWWWVDPPTHLFYFTRATLTRLLAKQGFQPVVHGTERGDDETMGFYVLFALNRRLGLGRRLRAAPPPTNGTAHGISTPAVMTRNTRGVWSVARRIGEGIEVVASPLGRLADRAGLGAELLVISRKVSTHPIRPRDLARDKLVPEPVASHR
jgi:SAM-dependent methyltransferase